MSSVEPEKTFLLTKFPLKFNSDLNDNNKNYIINLFITWKHNGSKMVLYTVTDYGYAAYSGSISLAKQNV